MISRAVRLLVSVSLMLVTVSSWVSTIAHFRFSIKEVPGFMVLLVLSYLLWHNVKLDWMLLRSYKLVFVPPKMSLWRFTVLTLLPFAVYCSQNLTILFDNHLSTYDLSVRIPMWLFKSEEWDSSLWIVSSDIGVRILLIYIFILSATGAMYFSGWFTENDPNRSTQYRFNLQTVYSRFALAVIALPFVFLNIMGIFRSFIFLFEESKVDPALLSLANTSLLFFKILNALVITAYALWILHDGVSIHRAWKSERGVMKTI
jgi:hypothetical protein